MDVSVLTRARRGLGVVVILLVFHAVAWMAAHRIQGGKSPHLRQEVALIASLEGDGFLPGLLTVTRGVPVRIFATSADGAHAVIIPEFRAAVRLHPGSVDVLDFTPIRTGSFQIVCEYHPRMRATLQVTE